MTAIAKTATAADAEFTSTASLDELASFKTALDEHAIVAMTDVTGKITYVNDKFCEISGYGREELVGANHRILASGHHAKPFFTKMFKTIAKGRTWHGEIKNRAKDGSYYWVDTTITPFKDADGKVSQYIAIRSDITSRKQVKEELRAHRDKLQELVRAATQALQTKTVALEEALAKEKRMSELQRQFISMASHEFRTPLAIIDATAQRLQRRAVKNRLSPDDAILRVEKIRSAVQRMTRLMESTLSLARSEDGEIRLDIGPCDVGAVLREVCASQQELSAGLNIICDVAELPGTLQADSGALEQVFTNLVSNAVKYAPGAKEIRVSARVEDKYAVIAVTDHGIGIDPDELDRIGERYFRARTSLGIEGTGIGLSLVKHLVARHGGKIDVQSEIGKGSTFTIRIPVDFHDEPTAEKRRDARQTA